MPRRLWREQVKPGIWRTLAGLAILAVMIAGAVLITPAYVRNWRFRQAVDEYLGQPDIAARSDEVICAEVADQAASLGITVKQGDVRVERATGRLRVEVRYLYHVDLLLYTVDLHFRAGGWAH